MAIRTSHIALGNLSLDLVEGKKTFNHLRHAFNLLNIVAVVKL